MFRKIALGTVLALGSISGAFAFENIGEIETPATYRQVPGTYAQVPAGYEALAASRRHTKTVRQAPQVPQMMNGYDPARDVSEY